MPPNKPPSKQQLILDAVTELKTAVVGIPGTDDRGMAGSISDMKTDLKQTNETVAEHSVAIARLGTYHENEGRSTKKRAGVIGGIGAIIAGAVYGIIRAFTNNG